MNNFDDGVTKLVSYEAARGLAKSYRELTSFVTLTENHFIQALAESYRMGLEKGIELEKATKKSRQRGKAGR